MFTFNDIIPNMTIKYTETSFGRRAEGEPKSVPVGTVIWLATDGNANWLAEPWSQTLRVDSPDQVTKLYTVGGTVRGTTSYRGKAISRQHFERSPLMGSLKDIVLWRRRQYFWEEDK
jgi:hypothetical protein